MDIWNNDKLLADLEKIRAEKKDRGRMTFDCLNLMSSEDRAFCSLGKPLTRADDGSIPLLLVMKGITSGVCKDCENFTTDE